MRLATRGLSAALLALCTLTAATPAAHAEDHRPCVSYREFFGLHYYTPIKDLEQRWEVEGLGEKVEAPVYGDTIIYPRCGYHFPDEAWFGLGYKRHADGVEWSTGGVWWKKPGAKPHGVGGRR